MPRRAVTVNRRPVTVNRRPVVVKPVVVRPVGAPVARAVMTGAAIGLMASAMGRRGRCNHKEQGSTIVVIQPFPGNLVAAHEKGQVAFITLPTSEPIPDDVKVVVKLGDKGTPVQIYDQKHDKFKYKLIKPGDSIPRGCKVIRTELAPGTLIQVMIEGKLVQQIVPPGQPLPSGAVVLQRPDGKPPPGTLVQITDASGGSSQQIIYAGQPIPPGAVIIPTGPSREAPKHHENNNKQPPPPTNVNLENNQSAHTPSSGLYAFDANRSDPSNQPPPPTNVDLSKNQDHVPMENDFQPPPPTNVNLSNQQSNSPPSGNLYNFDQKSKTSNLDNSEVPKRYSQPLVSPYQPSNPQLNPSQNQQRRASQGGSPPDWVPDAQAPACMKCRQPFTLTVRRHHCRNCGKVFCSNCAHATVTIKAYNFTEPVRVCNDCYALITNTNPPPKTSSDCSIM